VPVLTDDSLQQINENSLRLLENLGLRLENEPVRELLLAHGAREGSQSGLVRFPRQMVQEALATAPRGVRLCSLDGSEVVLTANGPSVFWTVNAIYAAEGNTVTPIDEAFFVRMCRVAQACQHVHATVAPSIQDYPANCRDFVGLRLLAEHTTKHLRPCIYTPDGTIAMREMGEVLAGGASLKERPVYSLGFTSVSPLTWSPFALEVFAKSSGHGVPIMINAEPIAGATGPVTLAGSLSLANAEALGGLTILQLLEPGRPCVFNLGFNHVLDMKTAVTRTGCPECALMQAAGAEISRSHGLPSASWASTESMVPDAQAAMEKSVMSLMHALSTVSIIWGIGQLESQRTISLPQMVIDDEIAGVALRAQRGLEVNEETLAYDVVAELGTKADYLGHDHTLRHYRSEVHYGEITWTNRRERWEQAGCQTMLERAQERVDAILSQPHETRLPEDVRAELLAIEARWTERQRV
jgi:trimethylamine---corrinoid protein Co-methyltransferase